MPIISNQMSLIGATFMLALAVAGILSRSGKTQSKQAGAVFAISWGVLLLSVLMILSNDAFFQFILNGLKRM